jgi:hypothetical protein
MLVTVALWLVVTGAYAYWYVVSRISLPGAVGYERGWDWQLFFFAITRLPILALVLALVLWVEWRWLPGRGSP